MHALDNPIWQALTTRQAHFAEIFGEARRFNTEITQLAAFREPNPDGYASLGHFIGPGGSAGLWFSELFEPQPGWELIATFPGLQMIHEDSDVDRPIFSNPADPITSPIVELGQRDSTEMVELATLTKPGPFGTRTHELGTYLGIRQNGRLIAMAGERLKVPGFTEVSAVCTHPEYTGKGYARALMLQLMKNIRQRGEVPFLHVRQANSRAVELYERMGFRTRKILYFTVIRKCAE
jgi:GNAT superfamily N-acetyltransferase